MNIKSFLVKLHKNECHSGHRAFHLHETWYNQRERNTATFGFNRLRPKWECDLRSWINCLYFLLLYRLNCEQNLIALPQCDLQRFLILKFSSCVAMQCNAMQVVGLQPPFKYKNEKLCTFAAQHLIIEWFMAIALVILSESIRFIQTVQCACSHGIIAHTWNVLFKFSMARRRFWWQIALIEQLTSGF